MHGKRAMLLGGEFRSWQGSIMIGGGTKEVVKTLSLEAWNRVFW